MSNLSNLSLYLKYLITKYLRLSITYIASIINFKENVALYLVAISSLDLRSLLLTLKETL
jgi:hypothetical protein